jgi:phosphoribosylformylglycinamidine synthase
MVGTNTVLLPGADAAVVRLKHTNKAIAISCDGNGRYCYLDPYEGGKSAVAEAARNVVCVGAQPVAITNCLNFGTPTDAEIFWQFTQCVEGMSEACRVLGTPVTGGNVSFYNENPGGAIDPTPVVGMLGVIDDMRKTCSPEFKHEGDFIAVLGTGMTTLGATEYLHQVHGLKKGMSPRVNLQVEKQVQQACLALIGEGLAQSAHDIDSGGLAICLAESSILPEQRSLGARISLGDDGGRRDDEVLFGESSSRILISCKPDDLPRAKDLARHHNVALEIIGTVAGKELRVARNGRELLSVPVSELYRSWKYGLQQLLLG